MRVLLAGGGSAGHTSPLVATADALRRARPDTDIRCLGTVRGLETRVIPDAGYRLELIPPVPMPRRPSLDLLRIPTRLAGAVNATVEVITRTRTEVVVGFGGYVAMPAYVAARRLRLPLVVHEGNALPGLANRFAARFCTDVVATSFPNTPLRHGRYIGLPIRRSIATLNRAAVRPAAREHFGLRPDLVTLLVTGGSQGARRINDAMGPAAPALAAAGIQVLHVAGPKGQVLLDRGRHPEDPPYVVVPYVDNMEFAYAAADAFVGRCGASSVTEAASLGLPAVFVPLPIGNGEQAFNAAAVVQAGGAMLVEDDAFTPAWVMSQIPSLLSDPERLATMSRAASGLLRSDADAALAELVLATGAAPRATQ